MSSKALWYSLAAVVALLAISRTQRGQSFIASGVDNVAKAVRGIRGIRNNNPGNLRANRFRGSLGVDAQGYAVFDTMANGVRASARQLSLYVQRGLSSVRQIVSTWAPSSENDTATYVANVSKWLGVSPDQPLRLDAVTHRALLRAIFRKELGYAASLTISDAQIDEAIRSA